jgi:glycosyltransferase involved in cell wall biosynthesis
LLSELPHAAILASGPPFSSFLLAARLSALANLPLILDYRDEWDLSTAYLEHKGNDALSRFIQKRMQRSVVRTAAALVTTTQASANALEKVRRQSGGKAPVRCIYNGYDADDFRAEPAPRPSSSESIFRLVYVGTLWNLTSAEALVAAIKQFCRAAPELASHLELVMAGRSLPSQDALLDQLKATPCRLVRHPYLAHAQAVGLMRSADALCVLLADVPGAERVMPAKVFEYLATGRPILTIAPRGEVWQVLQENPAAACFAPNEASAISRWLGERVQRKLLGSIPGCAAWNAARFSRRRQAGQLAALLTDAVDARHRS